MVEYHAKPKVWSLGATMKGLSLTDPSEWGLPWDADTSGQDLTASEAYKTVAFYRRCVDVRALGVGSIPWGVYRIGSDEPLWTEADEPPTGFEWLNVSTMLRRIETSLILERAAYQFKEGNESGSRVTNLVWWNPSTVKPHFTPQGVDYYERKVNQRTYRFEPQFVVPVWVQDPWTEQGPSSHGDGDATAVHARVLSDLSSYTSEQLRSGLVKRAVWVAKGRKPDEDEVERTETWLTRHIMGRGNERVKILSGEIEPKVIGSDLSDLSDIDISTEQQKAIATGLGVPHSVVMSDAANYATALADQFGFYVFTLVPQANTITDQLNPHLFRPLGLELRTEPERSEVMQRSEVDKAQSLVPLVDSGILTVNEARQTLGYDPVEFSEPTTTAPPVPPPDVQQDLRRWRMKVYRVGRDCEFTPDALSDTEASVIRERLAVGKSLDEAFSPPFASF